MTPQILRGAGLLGALLLAFVNLDAWPLLWFDEGVHLHVPKALVMFGVYADYSSEGFRHYGPTMSVGPTVMLPIAGAFQLFGITLLAARVIVAAYLVVAIVGVFLLSRRIADERTAWVATALVVTSTGVDLLYLGRQGLGEVPAFAFVVTGLVVWFAGWDRPTHARLATAGVLFGLAVVTKYQFLILLVPGLTLAWIVNRTYHRVLPDRVFLWPLASTLMAFAAWQGAALLYLGPSTVSENLTVFRRAAAGAAFGFSAANIQRAAATILSFGLYGGLLVPALVHAAVRSLDRCAQGFRWTALLCLIVPSVGWFLFASVGWPRYAFAAHALAGLLVARLLADVTHGFRLPRIPLGATGSTDRQSVAVAAAAWALLLLVVCLPLARRTAAILTPPTDYPRLAAAYLDQHVPYDRLIETWEPELGFLTNHRYHFPPAALLIDAVAYRFSDGPPPGEVYDFRANGLPDYVVRGEFATWVNVYPDDRLRDAYEVTATIGPYAIHRRRQPAPNGALSSQ